MKTPIYFCYIAVIFTISTTSPSAYSKSLYDNKLSLSKDNELNLYPVKRKVPGPEPPQFLAAHEEEPDLESPSVSPKRVRGIGEPSKNNLNVQGIYDRKSLASLEKELDLKRTSLINGVDKRADRMYKRDLRPQPREEAFGVVYGNGRPIGILEPFPQAYEFAPVYSPREEIEEIEPLPQINPRSVMDVLYQNDRLGPNYRGEWENSGSNIQDSAKFANDKYLPPLNDYKLTNRLNNGLQYKRSSNEQEKATKLANSKIPVTAKRDASLTDNKKKETSEQKDPKLASDNGEEANKGEVKRSTAGITNEKIDELKTALNRMQNPGPSDRVEEIEDNLRDILSDMGLIEGEYSGIESFKTKRESDKREADKEDENLEEGVNRIELVKATHDLPLVERNKREDKKEANDKDTEKTKDDHVPDGATAVKDQEVADNSNKLESSEIKVGEDSASLKSKSEASENQENKEIKTSDSKINVANYQSEGDAYIRSKRQENNDIMKGLEKSGDLTVSGNKSPLACSGNDAEVEKKRNKDQTSTTARISGKAKREQDELEYQKQIEQNIQSKIDAIKEQVKREIEALKAKSAQENQRRKRDVNTLLEEESSALDPQKHPDDKLEPHIRRRRHLEGLQPRTRTKRGLPDFSNLKNIDSGDYLDLMGEKQRDQRETLSDYEVDPQENRYLAEASQGDVGDEKKRNSNAQEGLAAGETVNLNVNNQDDSNSHSDNGKIQERSVDNPSNSDQLVEKKEAAENEIKQRISASQSGEKYSSGNKNEDQANVASGLQDVKSNNEDSAQKRSSDAQVAEEINVQKESNLENQDQAEMKKREVEETSNDDDSPQKRSSDTQVAEESNVQKESNLENQDQVEMKKRETEETPNINKPEPKEDHQEENKRDVEVSSKSTNSSPRSTEVPVSNEQANQKVETKRNLQDSSNSNPPPQPAEQDFQEVKKSRRRRRQVEEEVQNNPSMIYGRRKRANAIMPYAKSAFFPYRAEEEDGDDEGDEFDEDSFDDRSSLQKREAGYNSHYNNQFRRSLDYQQDYGDDYTADNYQPEQKRSLASKYVAKENADVYETPSNYLYHPVSYVRRKRQNFDQLATLHGGGPMLHHLAAIRERNQQQTQQLDDDSFRNKRNFNKNGQNSVSKKNKEEPENIADLSASDLFGALPQSYDGNNLLRFKRVKRELVSSSTETVKSTSMQEQDEHSVKV